MKIGCGFSPDPTGGAYNTPQALCWIITYRPFGPPSSALRVCIIGNSSFWFSNVGMYDCGLGLGLENIFGPWLQSFAQLAC